MCGTQDYRYYSDPTLLVWIDPIITSSDQSELATPDRSEPVRLEQVLQISCKKAVMHTQLSLILMLNLLCSHLHYLYFFNWSLCLQTNLRNFSKNQKLLMIEAPSTLLSILFGGNVHAAGSELVWCLMLRQLRIASRAMWLRRLWDMPIPMLWLMLLCPALHPLQGGRSWSWALVWSEVL